jgi:miniconductance mechanosensitive channel
MREEGFAQLYEGLVTWLLEQGVPSASMVYIILGLELVTLVLLLMAVYWATRLLLFVVIRRIFRGSESRFLQIALDEKVLRAITQLTPVIVFLVALPYLFREFEEATPILATLTYLYLIFVILRSVLTFLDAARAYFKHRPSYERRPIHIWVQVAKIAAYAFAAVLCLAVLVRQPPAIVIGGLGATSAVLLLVFRDTLLGFVAGVQIYAMDMVRVGDWIEMPKYGANGDVVEISLTTVKVRNWDRTMTTVPTYALISDSVKNWRFMSAGGARRIKRPLLVDVNSVRACDGDMLERFRDYEAALTASRRGAAANRGGDGQERPQAAQAQATAGAGEQPDAGAGATPDPYGVDEDGNPLTNLGMFRQYIECYLKHSPRISKAHTQMVRHLPPTADGIPLEIYAFADDARWVVYEKTQADLFEHFMAMAPRYDLVLFQSPAGRDLTEMGSLDARPQ